MLRRLTLGVAAVSLMTAGTLCAAQAQQKAPRPETQRNEESKIVPGPLPGARTSSDWRAGKLIGVTMTNTLGESVGKVDDIVIDSDGKVVAVLVRVGDFLGLGETSVAIGLRNLVISQSDPDHLEVKTSLSRDAIEQAASLSKQDGTPVTP